MAVEVAVLRDEDGVLEHLRQVFQAHERAVLELLGEDRAQALGLDDEGRQGLTRRIEYRGYLSPRKLDPCRGAAEVFARIAEVPREDLDHVVPPSEVPGPGACVRVRLIEEALELRDELLGRAAVARPQHEHVRVDARGEVPTVPFETGHDDGGEIGEDPEPGEEDRSDQGQDRQAVPGDPERQQKSTARGGRHRATSITKGSLRVFARAAPPCAEVEGGGGKLL